ncbi:MAG: SGNH/GDSL hydrolase family protein [Planctomycetota bacterium]|nr:SGNH/GDSL hydrolase family protein [Planctomycetota bacterium]MDA1139182.1 SGNH/GDSL hydrolase family protein [Planctomycetota bacterium]
MSLQIKSGQTVVMIGDSITDCGRRGADRPFGSGYVKQTVDLITAKYPERNITFINEGIGGNTVQDLRGRWHDDVLIHKPDWLTIKIGINDLHRTLGNALDLSPTIYEGLYTEILDLTQKHTKAKIILIDPFYISTDTKTGGHRSTVLELLPAYQKVVAKLAKKYSVAGHVKTHALFQKQLNYRPADIFCPEPVHPNATGHTVIALGVLEALGW